MNYQIFLITLVAIQYHGIQNCNYLTTLLYRLCLVKQIASILFYKLVFKRTFLKITQEFICNHIRSSSVHFSEAPMQRYRWDGFRWVGDWQCVAESKSKSPSDRKCSLCILMPNPV